jgi:hypothetical protein
MATRRRVEFGSGDADVKAQVWESPPVRVFGRGFVSEENVRKLRKHQGQDLVVAVEAV